MVSGVITTAMTVQGSGTSGNVISIVLEVGATFLAAAWASTGAFIANTKNYWSLTGGTIENTDNGSASSYGNSVASKGCAITDCSNFLIDGVLIKNLYRRTDEADTVAGSIGVSISHGSIVGALSNIEVKNCTIYEVQSGIIASYRPAGISGIYLHHNIIHDVNWGIAVGQANIDSVATNVEIYSNDIYDFYKWDEPATNSFHHDGIFCYASLAGCSLTYKVYGNFIHGAFGDYATSGIYNSGYVHGEVYNNILTCTGISGFGQCSLNGYDGATLKVYNNSFIGHAVGTGLHTTASAACTLTVKNNIFTEMTAISIYQSGYVTLISDRNLFYQLISTPSDRSFSYSLNSSGVFKSLAQWQALGFDTNGVSANPVLSAEYRPLAGSGTIGLGEDLSSTFTTDYAGSTRTIPWDIGAYMFTPRAFKRLARRLKFRGLSY